MKNTDSFPKEFIEAYNYLSCWKDTTCRHPRLDASNDGINFATKGNKNNNDEQFPLSLQAELTLATKGKSSNRVKVKPIKCYKCREERHIMPNCPHNPKQVNKDNNDEAEEQSVSANQLLTQGIHNNLEGYSFNSHGITSPQSRSIAYHRSGFSWIIIPLWMYLLTQGL